MWQLPLTRIALLALLICNARGRRAADSFAEPHEELRAHRVEFDALDADGNGALSAAEVAEGAGQIEENTDTDRGNHDDYVVTMDECEAFVEELDADGDALVSWREYETALLSQDFGEDGGLPEEFEGNMDSFLESANELTQRAHELHMRRGAAQP